MAIRPSERPPGRIVPSRGMDLGSSVPRGSPWDRGAGVRRGSVLAEPGKGVGSRIPIPVTEIHMYRSIVLPLDGSSFAEEALPLAARLALGAGAKLHLVHVIRPAPDVDFKTPEEDLAWRTQVREAASSALGELAAGLRKGGVTAHAEVREGRTVEAILECAREHEADLLVLTTHGAGGFRRWWLGSVADALLRRGETPVLLVRPWDDTSDRETAQPRFRKVLVPLDGSPASEAVLPHARWLREENDSSLVLVRVVPSPLEVGSLYGIPSVRVEGDGHRLQRDAAREYLEEVAARLEAGGTNGPPPELRVVEASSAAEGVLEAARVNGVDVIALSTQGRSGLGRTMFGSVGDKIIRGAVVPVLAVGAGVGDSDRQKSVGSNPLNP
ncbi:MAG: universal stress protein [Gemmatimonadales bacterium]|nr:MAG: universal stress protein [Gemmatimonadales bacterium]